jgi:hypothetical protein
MQKQKRKKERQLPPKDIDLASNLFSKFDNTLHAFGSH